VKILPHAFNREVQNLRVPPLPDRYSQWVVIPDLAQTAFQEDHFY
jgi:hypothetical protein